MSLHILKDLNNWVVVEWLPKDNTETNMKHLVSIIDQKEINSMIRHQIILAVSLNQSVSEELIVIDYYELDILLEINPVT